MTVGQCLLTNVPVKLGILSYSRLDISLPIEVITEMGLRAYVTHWASFSRRKAAVKFRREEKFARRGGMTGNHSRTRTLQTTKGVEARKAHSGLPRVSEGSDPGIRQT